MKMYTFDIVGRDSKFDLKKRHCVSDESVFVVSEKFVKFLNERNKLFSAKYGDREKKFVRYSIMNDYDNKLLIVVYDKDGELMTNMYRVTEKNFEIGEFFLA